MAGVTEKIFLGEHKKMNEKIKKYLTLAGNTINKLPFKKLSEKYSDKVPVLKSIAPFANFIVCGLVVVLIIAKIIVPQVKFNCYMAKIEKPWKEEIQSYETLDFSEEFKTTFDKISSEMDNFAKDIDDIKVANDKQNFDEQLKDLRKLLQSKYDELEKLSKVSKEAEKQLEDIIRIKLSAKLNAISDKTSSALENIKNYDSVMSNSQFSRYKKYTEELPKQSIAAFTNCISRSSELYTDYSSKLETLYSEKSDKINAIIDKINASIKEINRKAYIAFVQKNIIGYWEDDHKEGKIEFNSNGTFSFKYHREGFKPKRPPKAMYNMTDGSTLINLINEDEFITPERLRNFSGRYSFQDDVLILDVKSAEYKNMPEVKSGDKLKVKISFADNGNRLWFDKKTYKRK